MKPVIIVFLFSYCLLCSCKDEAKKEVNPPPVLSGTWQLISGTTISKGVSSFTDYTKNQRMIKIINNSHFSFLKHDLNLPKDSANNFDAGGGSYSLEGNQYIEHLDYYKDRNWEGKTFTFTVTINNDTLIQRGMEKVENEGVEREIIERYIRVKG